MAALEKALEDITKAYSANLQAIKNAFAFNDAHITVLQMVAHDIVSGDVRMIPMVEDEITFHKLRHEKDEPVKDWYEFLEENHMAPSRELGQSIDLEWYHSQYLLTSKAIELFNYLHKIAEA